MNIHEIYRLIEGISLTQFSGAGIVFTTKAGYVLMLKKQNGVWGMPGGKPMGDEIPEETAIRESEEETGLKVNELEDPIIFYYKDRKYYSYVYLLEKEKHIKLSKEHKNYKWVHYTEMDKFKITHPLRSQLTAYIDKIKKIIDK